MLLYSTVILLHATVCYCMLLQHGARWIYDTDDDNELKRDGPSAIPTPAAGDLVDEVAAYHPLYNLYSQLSSNRHAWPRGFPLEVSAATRYTVYFISILRPLEVSAAATAHRS